MALKKGEKRLLGLLGIVAFVFFIDRFVCSSGNQKGVSLKSGGATATVVQAGVSRPDVASALSSTQKGVVSQRRFDSWGRDPFSSTGSTGSGMWSDDDAEAKSGKTPVLNGIFWKQEKAYVMIDGDILSEGEEKDGLRVEKVEERKVYCSKGGRSFTLYWR